MKNTLLLVLSAITLTACNASTEEIKNQQVGNENPILQEWDTPFGL